MKIKKLLYLLLTILIAGAAIEGQAIPQRSVLRTLQRAAQAARTQAAQAARVQAAQAARVQAAQAAKVRAAQAARVRAAQAAKVRAAQAARVRAAQAARASQRGTNQAVPKSKQAPHLVTQVSQNQIGDDMNMHPNKESLTGDGAANLTKVLSRSKTSKTDSEGKNEEQTNDGAQGDSNKEPLNGPYKSKENKSHNGQSQEKDDSHGHGHGHHDNSNSCDSTTNEQQCHIKVSAPISIQRTVFVDSISSSQNQFNEWIIRQEISSSYRKDVDSSKGHSSRDKRVTPENLILPNDTTKCEETDTTRIQ